jgi:hypothetical protein
MLDKKQQFKFALLKEAATQGITLDELSGLLEKQAEGGLPLIGAIQNVGEHGAKKVIDVAANLGGLGTKAMLAGAAVAPIGLGALTGSALANYQNQGQETPQEEKQREIIDAYRREAERARLNNLARRVKEQVRSQTSYGRL